MGVGLQWRAMHGGEWHSVDCGAHAVFIHAHPILFVVVVQHIDGLLTSLFVQANLNDATTKSASFNATWSWEARDVWVSRLACSDLYTDLLLTVVCTGSLLP